MLHVCDACYSLKKGNDDVAIRSLRVKRLSCSWLDLGCHGKAVNCSEHERCKTVCVKSNIKLLILKTWMIFKFPFLGWCTGLSKATDMKSLIVWGWAVRGSIPCVSYIRQQTDYDLQDIANDTHHLFGDIQVLGFGVDSVFFACHGFFSFSCFRWTCCVWKTFQYCASRLSKKCVPFFRTCFSTWNARQMLQTLMFNVFLFLFALGFGCEFRSRLASCVFHSAGKPTSHGPTAESLANFAKFFNRSSSEHAGCHWWCFGNDFGQVDPGRLRRHENFVEERLLWAVPDQNKRPKSWLYQVGRKGDRQRWQWHVLWGARQRPTELWNAAFRKTFLCFKAESTEEESILWTSLCRLQRKK